MKRERGMKAVLAAIAVAILVTGGLFALNTGKDDDAGSGTAVVTEADAGTPAETEADAGTPAEVGMETPAESDAYAAQDTAAETEADEEAAVAFEDREVPVFRETLTEETIPLRFYEDMPNVAYVKIEDYHHLFLPEDQVTVTETGEGTGIYEVTNETGSAVIDTVQETITSDDLSAFTNIMGMVQPGMANAYLDGYAYCRWSRREVDPAQVPVELALSEYGIDLRSDQGGLYLPVATLSDIYSDLCYHFALYTNGKVYVEDENRTDAFDDRDEEVIRNYMAEDQIPEDLAEFGYGELCFAIDHFFGLPDRVALNDSIREKGLDRTLEEYGDTGIRIRELLQSTEKGEYLFGLDCLGGLLYDGGHTRIRGSIYEGAMSDSIHEKYLEAKNSGLAAEERWSITENTLWMINGLAVKQMMRDVAYGEGVNYVKKGNTAVCVFDTFWSDYFDEAEAYVHGEIDALPEDDTIRIFMDALNQAKEDPEVENFIIDISNNTGGSVDILVTLAALLTGENEIGVPLTNTLTGQTIVDYYQVDANMDGEFNDADKIPCDLRIGVLTAGNSFSAGNMFPAVMKSYGAVILGEQSGGGCCAIQCMSTTDGLWYRISSSRMHMTTADGENIDLGVPVDVDLVEKNADGSDKMISTPIVGVAVEEDGSLNYEKDIDWETPDYTLFYDIDRLGEEMNKFFGKE